MSAGGAPASNGAKSNGVEAEVADADKAAELKKQREEAQNWISKWREGQKAKV